MSKSKVETITPPFETPSVMVRSFGYSGRMSPSRPFPSPHTFTSHHTKSQRVIAGLWLGRMHQKTEWNMQSCHKPGQSLENTAVFHVHVNTSRARKWCIINGPEKSLKYEATPMPVKCRACRVADADADADAALHCSGCVVQSSCCRWSSWTCGSRFQPRRCSLWSSRSSASRPSCRRCALASAFRPIQFNAECSTLIECTDAFVHSTSTCTVQCTCTVVYPSCSHLQRCFSVVRFLSNFL